MRYTGLLLGLLLVPACDEPRPRREPRPAAKEIVYDSSSLPPPGGGRYGFQWLLPDAEGRPEVVPGLWSEAPLREPRLQVVHLELPQDYLDHHGEFGILLSFEDPDGARHPLLGNLCAFSCGSDDPRPLTPDEPFALGLAFEDQSGRVTVDTPSTADPSDAGSGVWAWSAAEPGVAGLALDPPANGWSWAAWLVDGDDALPLGVISDPAAPDSDGAGPDAGPDPAPPFPGQDFVDPPRDVRTGTYVLSLEPGPPGAAPWLPLLEAPLGGSGWIPLDALPPPTAVVTVGDPIR